MHTLFYDENSHELTYVDKNYFYNSVMVYDNIFSHASSGTFLAIHFDQYENDVSIYV